jgi:dCMP deaminase
MMEDDHCVATIHAEANAIIQAARNGVMIDGSECYVTASPCWSCFKTLANAGVSRIVYGEFYRDERVFEVARQLGIEMVQASLPAGHPSLLPLASPVPSPGGRTAGGGTGP